MMKKVIIEFKSKNAFNRYYKDVHRDLEDDKDVKIIIRG